VSSFSLVQRHTEHTSNTYSTSPVHQIHLGMAIDTQGDIRTQCGQRAGRAKSRGWVCCALGRGQTQLSLTSDVEKNPLATLPLLLPSPPMLSQWGCWVMSGPRTQLVSDSALSPTLSLNTQNYTHQLGEEACPGSSRASCLISVYVRVCVYLSLSFSASL
jgi:hypothetical protein